jgi:Flp pilus assembly protein TadG
MRNVILRLRNRLGLRAFSRDNRGSVLMEMAFVLPTMLVMFLGTTELGRYVYLNLKLQNTASGVADLATRDSTLTNAGLAEVYAAAAQIASPFDIGQSGVVVVSAVGVDSNDLPVVLWQSSGGGGLAEASRVGSPGGLANVPAGLVVEEGDTAIVSEIFYLYQPWLGEILPSSTLAKTAYYRPRLSTLEAISPDS